MAPSLQDGTQTMTAALRLGIAAPRTSSIVEPTALGCKWYGHDWDDWVYMHRQLAPSPPTDEHYGWMVCKRCRGMVHIRNVSSDGSAEISVYVKKIYLMDRNKVVRWQNANEVERWRNS